MDYDSFPVTKANDLEARLLTASATTGWLDWIHGELWLFPGGLFRRPLGLIATFLNGTGPTTNPTSPVWHNFDEETFAALRASKRNHWIPREQIKKAYLHHGTKVDRLRLELVDRPPMMFLWFPHDKALAPLRGALEEWLGDRLIID